MVHCSINQDQELIYKGPSLCLTRSDATIRSNIIAKLIVLAIQKSYVERLNKSM